MIKALYTATIAIAILSFAGISHAIPLPEIRVLVINGVTSVTVDGLGSPMKLLSAHDKSEESIGYSVSITASSIGLTLDDKSVGKSIVIVNREKRYRIGERTFHGKLAMIWKSNGRFQIIDHLPLERYLVGIVGSEISPRWPIESIKAQVVAARTYALNKMEQARHATRKKPYDITSTILSQVYHGSHVEDSRSAKAVNATRGEVLYRGGALFPSYYHSCCGGQTEHAHNVWDGEEGPPIVVGSFCERSPKYMWSYKIPVSTFIRKLGDDGVPVKKILTIATTPYTDSPRVSHLLIEDETELRMVKATRVRKILSYKDFQSTWFDVKMADGMLYFQGRGYGHGVGLCQYGAKGMAEAGHNYRNILKFYYSDAEVGKRY